MTKRLSGEVGALQLGAIIALLTLAAGFAASPATGQSTPVSRRLSSFNWSLNAKPNLAENPSSESVILAAQASIDGDERKLCWFRFVDFRHSGNLTLVMSRAGDGGHGSCGTEMILDMTANGFELYQLGMLHHMGGRR